MSHNQTKKPVLKPCPFCGTPDTGEYPFRSTRGNEAASYVAGCPNPNCGVEIWADTLEKAVAAWNRRPAPESVDLGATTAGQLDVRDAMEQMLLAASEDIDEMAKRTGPSRFPSVDQLRGWKRMVDSILAALPGLYTTSRRRDPS